LNVRHNRRLDISTYTINQVTNGIEKVFPAESVRVEFKGPTDGA
jgi:hypothetical protein